MKEVLCPRCPVCGQDTAAPIPVERLKLVITDQQLEIFRHVINRPGISTAELTDALYAHRWDGGPDTGEASVRMHITRANKALRDVGLKIEASHRGPGAWWRIVQTEKVAV